MLRKWRMKGYMIVDNGLFIQLSWIAIQMSKSDVSLACEQLSNMCTCVRFASLHAKIWNTAGNCYGASHYAQKLWWGLFQWSQGCANHTTLSQSPCWLIFIEAAFRSLFPSFPFCFKERRKIWGIFNLGWHSKILLWNGSLSFNGNLMNWRY